MTETSEEVERLRTRELHLEREIDALKRRMASMHIQYQHGSRCAGCDGSEKTIASLHRQLEDHKAALAAERRHSESLRARVLELELASDDATRCEVCGGRIDTEQEGWWTDVETCSYHEDCWPSDAAKHTHGGEA